MTICVYIKKGGIVYNKLITMYLPIDVIDELNQMAKDQNRPRAPIIREMINEGLEKRKKGTKDHGES